MVKEGGIFADVGKAPESVHFEVTLGQLQENPKILMQIEDAHVVFRLQGCT